MKVHFEQMLHLGAAAMTLAAAFGFDAMIAALSLAAINMGLGYYRRALILAAWAASDKRL